LASLQAGVVPGQTDPILERLLGAATAELVSKAGWNALVINPGSTSTKVSVFAGLNLMATGEVHLLEGVQNGVPERVGQIVAWFERQKLRLSEITGIGARGGFVAPLPAGTYRIATKMIEDLAAAPFQHASNLSVPMAIKLGELIGPDAILTITDPVTVDELDRVYRITGSARILNDALAAHYLNHRASAELVAQILGVERRELHLITCHLGGGASAARHLEGRMVQVAQAFGSMPSANRSGALPLPHVLGLLESHELTLEDLRAEIMSRGGLLSLAGTSSFRALFEFASGPASRPQQEKIELLIEFFANRVAGCILDLSATSRPVDLVLLTGGLANDESFCRRVAERIHLAAPVVRLPGSVEQEALAAGLFGACARPEARGNYLDCREQLRAARDQDRAMLALPLLGPPSAKTDRLSAPARLDDVIAVASAEGERCTVAVVGADNEEALLAAKQANEAGPRPLARFLLVGPYSRISQLSWELDVAIDQDNLVIVDAGDPVETAVELMRAGLADTLMKGSVTTAALLKGYLGYLKGKGLTGRGLRLSHLGMFEIPGRSKLVGITDAAINTYPDVEARIEILENALDALHLLGYQRPKVAVVSAVEKPSKAVTSSVEGEVIATRFQGRQDLIIEGPLSVDLALSPQSAREKGYRGRIQGDADLLLVPDIDAGNAIYKAFTVTSGAALAGAVIGGEVPFILTSRGDSSRSKFASVALVLALTRRRKARGNSDRQVGRPK
jgi:phosphate butyryltransferase